MVCTAELSRLESRWLYFCLLVAAAYWRVYRHLGFTTTAAEIMTTTRPNQPAAGNAGIASQLAIGHHWPGVPEPER